MLAPPPPIKRLVVKKQTFSCRSEPLTRPSALVHEASHVKTARTQRSLKLALLPVRAKGRAELDKCQPRNSGDVSLQVWSAHLAPISNVRRARLHILLGRHTQTSAVCKVCYELVGI